MCFTFILEFRFENFSWVLIKGANVHLPLKQTNDGFQVIATNPSFMVLARTLKVVLPRTLKVVLPRTLLAILSPSFNENLLNMELAPCTK